MAGHSNCERLASVQQERYMGIHGGGDGRDWSAVCPGDCRSPEGKVRKPNPTQSAPGGSPQASLSPMAVIMKTMIDLRFTSRREVYMGELVPAGGSH